MIIDFGISLYKKIKKLGLNIKLICDVGVHNNSILIDFTKNGIDSIFFEPDPICVSNLKDRYGYLNNLTIHNVAIFNKNTKIELYRYNDSTFVSELDTTPAIINDKYKFNKQDKFEAEAKLFSEYDKGNIDVINIDTEGCEWFVLKHMISRPKVICIETHGFKYKNKYLTEIKQWMKEHNYKLWYQNISNSIYILDNIPVPFFTRYF